MVFTINTGGPALADMNRDSPHPTETPELLEAKLKQLDEAVEKLPSKSAYEEAVTVCPDLVKELKPLFLRTVKLETDKAALRMIRYWEKRLEIFGRGKAFLPLTLAGALKDDVDAVLLGFLRLVGTTDPEGRPIIWLNPHVQDKSKYSSLSMLRALWYMVHAAVGRDETAQRMGYVLVEDPSNMKMNQIDMEFGKLNQESFHCLLPVRLVSHHYLNIAWFEATVLMPLMLLFLTSREQREKIRIHRRGGDVMDNVAKYGLTLDRLPTELGGSVQVNHEEWVANRKQNGL